MMQIKSAMQTHWSYTNFYVQHCSINHISHFVTVSWQSRLSSSVGINQQSVTGQFQHADGSNQILGQECTSFGPLCWPADSLLELLFLGNSNLERWQNQLHNKNWTQVLLRKSGCIRADDSVSDWCIYSKTQKKWTRVRGEWATFMKNPSRSGACSPITKYG